MINKIKIIAMKVVIVFVKTMCFVMGLFMLLFSGYPIYEAKDSENWPVALGTVITSEITRTGRGWYCPAIKVSYLANGETFITGKFSSESSSCSPSENKIERILSNFVLNSEVNVYWKPSKPDRAFLYKGYVNPFLYIGVFGALYMLFLSFYLKVNNANKIINQDK